MSYSKWHKLDLHIHTNWSKKTKINDYKGNFSVDVLKKKLIENDVSIFSLTDHNIINLEAYREYYAKYDGSKDPLLLVGVELDILVNNSGKQKTYHSLLIFNYSDIESAKDVSSRLEEEYKSKGLEKTKRVLTIDEIVKIFPEDDFFFIPHAGNTKSIVNSYQGNIEDAQKMVLLMQSAFEKVPEKNIQIYNDGFNNVLEERFRNKNDHAYIEFSDNHNIGKYPCAGKGVQGRMHNFYYVKGGKNYETLRLAFIDPGSRIKSSSELNDIKSTYNFLDKFKIEGDNFLPNSSISFSPHLNVIIGGRSSGKSLLMSLIGDKIDCIQADRNKYDKFDYNSALLKTSKDSNFKDTASIPREDIIYLRQGDIVRYFEENKLSELAKEADKKSEYTSLKDAFTERRQELEFHINKLVDSYSEYLPNSQNKYVLHSTTLDHILSENYVFNCDLEEIRNEFDLKKDISENKKIVQRIIEDTESFSKQKLFDFNEDEEELIQNFISLLQEKEELAIEKSKKNVQKIKFWDSVESCLQEVNNDLSFEAQQKKESQESLKSLKKDIYKRFRQSKSLKYRTTKLEDFDYEIDKSITINNQVDLNLEVGHLEEKDLKKLIGDGINDFDYQRSLYINLLGVAKDSKGIKNYTETSPGNLKKKIYKELEVIIEALNNPRDYLSYGNGETSKNNSPGYNSEKYLEILLKNPKSKIIFIDQPEDNLGNKFISDKLVKLIRDIKFSKQIFLVTHNPSIVVYGDAENIIIARNKNKKISYEQAVLENPYSQQEVCSILDGGEYIFDMRAKKYNINKIMRDSEDG
ncbi:hypothetical protein [Halalkalibaculum sp. DA384]|uniref:hypothetical protein n=1 Tax=Halalkalibaculum sp. DA384 TaxID=3373606 RepID=UPI0037549D5B